MPATGYVLDSMLLVLFSEMTRVSGGQVFVTPNTRTEASNLPRHRTGKDANALSATLVRLIEGSQEIVVTSDAPLYAMASRACHLSAVTLSHHRELATEGRGR